MRQLCDQVDTTLQVLETGTPRVIRVELYIGFLKEAVRRDMCQSNSPMSLWCYCIEQRANIHNAIPRPLFQEQIPMYTPWVSRATYLIFSTSDGMNVSTIATQVLFRKIKKILVEFSVPQLMREMRYHKLCLLSS